MSSLPRYCIAKVPVPLLNHPNLSLLKSQVLPVDSQGLFRPLEMMALPGTKFKILKRLNPSVLEVVTNDYPGGPYYIEEGLVIAVKEDHPERKRVLPPTPQILAKLESALGLPYIWGGNSREGFGPHFKGVDCSGLLYEATDGFTPRNTADLMLFGKKIEIISNVKRLDIVVWPGHVIIFLDPQTTIESVHPNGVILRNALERLEEVSDKFYTIRRFVPETA